MVKVYAISLAVGVLAMILWLFSATVAESTDRTNWDPTARWGLGGKTLIGALLGFGMGGLSAEFAPIDLMWPAALGIAAVAALLSVFWVRYAVGHSEEAR